MRDIHLTSLDKLTELLLSELSLSRSGPAMPEVPLVFRNMIASFIFVLSVAPSCRLLDPSVISRTYKYLAVGLATMANVSDNDLSAYVHSAQALQGNWMVQAVSSRRPCRLE